MEDRIYTIGFSNVDEINPFTVQVRENLEMIAAQRPDVELVVRDNNQDTPRAIENSAYFASIPVDVAIVFHIDERAGQSVVKPLRDKGIPVICVDIPIARTTYFGLNNQRVGEEAGEVLARWIQANWNGQLDKTLVVTEYLLLDFFRKRVDCAVDKLEEMLPSFSRESLLYLDNGGKPEITAERVLQVLNRWGTSKHIAVLCMNDNVAIGALDAIDQSGRHDEIALLSHDGTHVAVEQFEREISAMVVSTKLDASEYGKSLIELGIKIVNGESVPTWNYVNTVPLSRADYRAIMDDD